MGRLRTKAAECQYKKYKRLQTQQFINRLNGNGMVNEILKEVATLEDTEDTTGQDVLLLVHRVEVQGAQKSGLNEIKRQNTLMSLNDICCNRSVTCPGYTKGEDGCKYCGTKHPLGVSYIS